MINGGANRGRRALSPIKNLRPAVAGAEEVLDECAHQALLDTGLGVQASCCVLPVLVARALTTPFFLVICSSCADAAAGDPQVRRENDRGCESEPR